MAGDEPSQRYLIAVGITAGLSRSTSQIRGSVERMVEVFAKDFGYERVTALDIDPSAEQIRNEIRGFSLKCGPDDVVALYYTGHADQVNESHRVWTGDTVDPVAGTLETKLLAELMLTRTPLRNALMILDTCFAGQGGAEALLASVSAMGEGDGKTLALLTAAYPREQIVAGDFSRLFAHAVGQRSVAGYEPPYLALGAIAGAIDADKSRPGWQTVSHSVLFGRTDELPFFPNQRYNPRLHGLDLFTQLRIEQRELRLADLRGHFLPRARGVDVPAESGWRFVGRTEALRDLVSWLRDADNPSALVVTGGPGSGKSAVIGRLVVLSDQDWRRTVPVENLPPDTIPPEGCITTGIHARGMTTAQVLAALCAEAGVQAATPADLLREMRNRKITVAIDAIDEALDPPGLVSTVLRPLMEAGPAEGLRLLVGTRPHLVDSLGGTPVSVHLDDERFADPDSLYAYVLRALQSDEQESPYRSAPPDLVAGVAKAVAEAAGYSFLVALIVSRTLLSQKRLPDPANRAWREALPGTAADAMRDDLETRLGADADRARDLLRPLAFAAGAGLPWEDLWAPLAARLSGQAYDDEDLIWLRRHAGSYVLEAMEAGRSVYRLYHAALAEYLRQDHAEEAVHDSFTEFLMGRVPRASTGPDWARAHPYTLAHLATHATRAGRLDSLLRDPGYLVNADSVSLLAALPAASGPDAQLAAVSYQRAVHQFRGRPERERLSYLEFGARIARAPEMASRIASIAPDRDWSVRWAHWPREHPHRILGDHLGPLADVLLVEPTAGKPVVVSIGADAKLRMWDLLTTEPLGTHAIGGAPHVAAQAVRFSGHRVVIVIISADGMLHFWDMATATLQRTVPVAARWRRMAWGFGLTDLGLELKCITVPGDRHFAITRGRGIPTSVWEVPSGRLVAALPAQVGHTDIGYVQTGANRLALAATIGFAMRWMHDLQENQDLPFDRNRDVHRMPRFPNSSGAIAKNISYFTTVDGDTVLAKRSRARVTELWDVTNNRMLGTWHNNRVIAEVRLANGKVTGIPLQSDTSLLSSPGAPTAPPIPNLQSGQPTQDSRILPGLEINQNGRFLHIKYSGYRNKPATSLTLAGHIAAVTGHAWAPLPDGTVAAITVSDDGTVRRWDINFASKEDIPQETSASNKLRSITAITLDNGLSLGLTIDEDGGIPLWDLSTGAAVGRLAEYPPSACAVDVVHPAGSTPLAVTSSTDGMLRTWSLPDGKPVSVFPADRDRWAGSIACVSLSDGTVVAVTSGHGRKVAMWNLATGKLRKVRSVHRAWTSCVGRPNGPGQETLVLSGGLDNHVNAWDLARGRRHRFRVTSPQAFLAPPLARHVRAIRALPLRDGKVLTLVATENGMVRTLTISSSMRRVHRTGTMRAEAVSADTLSNGFPVIITASEGMVEIWSAADLALKSAHTSPLCEINVEVPVEDICVIDGDVAVLVTPNGLLAIQLNAESLANRANSMS